MTPDELKAAWAANIDSHEKFVELLQRSRHHIPREWTQALQFVPAADRQNVMTLDHQGDDLWPLQRDIIRESIGYYKEPTSIIKWMRQLGANMGLGQQFPHVCVQDPTKVAYMPDATQAKADRKRSVSMGRFLREHLLFVPESEIQRLEQQHRSELDDTFKLAETVEAIEAVYVGMMGDTGCMRYDKRNFSHDEYHPSAVYASPGMGVAYTEDHNGTVKSRSVVWVNPEDASDKRYVRIYGDPVLRKKLEAHGYKLRGLAGAKIRALRDAAFGDDDTFVMPWIDPAGGIHAGGVDRTLDAQWAVRYEGEDEFLTLIGSDTLAKLQKAGVYPPDIQTQSGHVTVPKVDTSTFVFTCAVTGRSTNRLDQETCLWLTGEGEIKRARVAAVSAMDSDTFGYTRVQYEGRLQHMYCLNEHRAKFEINGHAGYFNDEATRAHLNIAELDPVFYPERKYGIRSECVHVVNPATQERSYILKADAYMVYEVASNKYVHESMLKPLKREGYLAVAIHNGVKGLAHKDNPRVAMTGGGKRVVVNVHDVTRLWDGSWEYTRNAETISICNTTFSVRKGSGRLDIRIPKETWATRLETTFDQAWERRTGRTEEQRYEIRERQMVRTLSGGYDGCSGYHRKGTDIVVNNHYERPVAMQPIFDAATEIVGKQLDADWLAAKLGYQRVKALAWARNVRAIQEAMREFDKAQELMLAEANAVEAPVTASQVIEKLNTLADADMDRLIAEVDDTLATAVVRRWPNLQRAGMVQPVQELSPVVAAALDQMEQALAPPDGMGPQSRSLEENLIQMEVGQVDRLVIHEDERSAFQRRLGIDEPNADDQLLAGLQAAGLTTIVIDESTDFDTLPRLNNA